MEFGSIFFRFFTIRLAMKPVLLRVLRLILIGCFNCLGSNFVQSASGTTSCHDHTSYWIAV